MQQQESEVAVKLGVQLAAMMKTNLKHLTLPDLSWGNSFKHLCGLEKPQFAKLLNILAEPLQSIYPKSKLTCTGGKVEVQLP